MCSVGALKNSGPISKELNKFLRAVAGLIDNGSQSFTLQIPVVIGDSYANSWFVGVFRIR